MYIHVHDVYIWQVLTSFLAICYGCEAWRSKHTSTSQIHKYSKGFIRTYIKHSNEKELSFASTAWQALPES